MRYPLCLLLVSLGCTGAVGGGPARPGGGPGGDIDPPAAMPGDVPIRRLNAAEIEATVEDLFGVTLDDAHRPAETGRAGLFDRDVTADHLDQPTAQAALDRAVWIAREADVGALTEGCADDVCARAWIEATLPRALRRAPSDEEVARYLARYDDGATRGGVEEGIRQVIGHLAASPDVLYHVARTDGVDHEGRARLLPEEIASRLAFLLWRRPPDEALLARAAAGGLDDDGGVGATVEEMLADPRASRGVAAFHAQWLSLDGVLAADGREGADAYGEALGRRLRGSLLEWVARAHERDLAVAELLGGDGVYADADIAALLDLELPAGSEGFVPGRRTGVLLHPGFLAQHAHRDETSPILRGAITMRRVACADIADPTIDVSEVVPDPTLPTTRERVEALTSGPGCAGCHDAINPIGYALEGYDHLGRPRTEDGGEPVHTAARIMAHGLEGSFADADEMLDLVASSEVVAECYLRQWFRFAFERQELPAENALLYELHERWRGRGGGVRTALRVVATSPELLSRPVEAL